MNVDITHALFKLTLKGENAIIFKCIYTIKHGHLYVFLILIDTHFH